MGKGAIFITWGSTARGRENEALSVFADALSYYDALEKAGRIQGKRVYLNESGDLGRWAGTIILEGDLSALQAVSSEVEYRRLLLRAGTTTENLTVTFAGGGSPDDIGETMGLYGEAIGRLG